MTTSNTRRAVGHGPLAGVRIVEMEGIGPVPHAAMVLADLGAEVLRISRSAAAPAQVDLLARGRQVVAVDLKHERGTETVLRLIEGADVLLEGFRPGVMERLGLGPDACLARNPSLVYGRMTGWGQRGPLADRAGHDINYLAIGGLLHGFRRAGERPLPPVNLVGDFGGGSLYLVVGVLAALWSARGGGQGQVIDAAMVDGAASLATMLWSFAGRGTWDLDRPGTNILDTGAHFYEVYECADGEHMAVGAVEPQFYARVLEGLGLADHELPAQRDQAAWPAMKQRFAAIFATRTRDEWTAVFAGLDACVTPVLSPSEALRHPHIVERSTYVPIGGVVGPAPAPRFSATVTEPRPPLSAADPAHLLGWDFTEGEVAELTSSGAVGALADPAGSP